MGIKKGDNIILNPAPVTKRMPNINRSPLVAGAEHLALGFESTAHRDDLVIGGRVIIPTIDQEERLKAPVWFDGPAFATSFIRFKDKFAAVLRSSV